MSPLIQVLIVGVGTYLFRLSAIALLAGGRQIPERVEETLRLIAPAVLAGLTANALLMDQGEARPLGLWHLAAAVALGVALWRKSVGLTLLCGMAALWITSAIW